MTQLSSIQMDNRPSKGQWPEKKMRWSLIPLIPLFFGLAILADALLGGPRDFPVFLAFVFSMLAFMAPTAIPWCMRRFAGVEPIPVPGVFPSFHIPSSAKLCLFKGMAILAHAVAGCIWLQARDFRWDLFSSWNLGPSFWAAHAILSALVIGMYGRSKAGRGGSQAVGD